ncbi:MAG: hypothetical protein AAF497_01200, partial [Planctomycetota bacterium]
MEWAAQNLPMFLLVLLGLALLGMLVGYLISSVRNGPAGAIRTVARAISDAFRDMTSLSFRRIYAMAKLAVKESIRRYVLIVFAVFVIILLFAGWYLDSGADNPGRLYISFVMKTTNFLVIMLGIFLSAFSLPNDIKTRTIYTVVTKPVRPWEIVIGRIVGFTFVGSLILALMCLLSWGFVVRGLRHEHAVDQASVQPTEDGTGWVGRTTQHANHRHEFIIGEDGETTTDANKGHFHVIESDGDADSPKLSVGGQAGALEAKVPVWGDLRYLNRKGEPSLKGNQWHLDLVFSRLKVTLFLVKRSKCALLVRCADFLGHVVGSYGICVALDKITAISKWPVPTAVVEVQAILGLCNYFCRFVDMFAAIARPLTDLTAKYKV